MTQLSDKEHKVQMEDMRSFDEQMPCVGIFWYDPQDHTLFGVRKKHLDTKFKGDYTQVPRGRVAWTIDKFICACGQVGRVHSGRVDDAAGAGVFDAVLRVRVRGVSSHRIGRNGFRLEGLIY